MYHEARKWQLKVHLSLEKRTFILYINETCFFDLPYLAKNAAHNDERKYCSIRGRIHFNQKERSILPENTVACHIDQIDRLK